MKTVYLTLLLLGIVCPWWFNVEFIRAHGGFSWSTFVAEAFTTPASRSVSVDILVASLAWMVWMVSEARRLRMRHAWIYVVLVFAVAFAFACPCFLYMRERKLEAATARSDPGSLARA